MRILAAVLVVAAMLVPLGLMGTATAANRNLTPVVIGPMPTDRFDGGNLIAVKAGDALFGVRYGTSNHLNDIVIFAEYKRFLGGAQIVDGQGNELASRGIPVYTVLAQSLTRFIEFRERNATDGFDLTSVDPFHVPLTQNVPVKVLMLRTAWELTGLTNETSGGVTYVNFTVSATNLAYMRDHADDGTRILGDATLNATAPTHPELFTRDRVYFNDTYTRIGRFRWATNVTVDGQPARMTFNIQGGGRIAFGHDGAYFVGFWLRGAFVYPAGQVISHDPEISTEAFVDLPIGVNLTPFTILAAQLAVVGIAIGPALYRRAKARRQK